MITKIEKRNVLILSIDKLQIHVPYSGQVNWIQNECLKIEEDLFDKDYFKQKKYEEDHVLNDNEACCYHVLNMILSLNTLQAIIYIDPSLYIM